MEIIMKRKFGDRKDAKRIRDIDGIHIAMANCYPGRTNNEAFISENIDLTNINAYLERKNADNPAYKYNLFQIIVTTILKTIMLRPKLNHFIVNGHYYARNKITLGFIVKRVFSDDGAEGLAILEGHQEDTIDTIHDQILKEISRTCSSSTETNNSAEASLDILTKLPGFVLKPLFSIVRCLDRHGRLPQSLTDSDPDYCSAFVSNLGSIDLPSGYHHLNNWGTCSLFCVIGKKSMKFFSDGSGNATMKPAVTLGLTIDERIADGYYYAKTLRLIRKLMQNPELLELPLREEVDY